MTSLLFSALLMLALVAICPPAVFAQQAQSGATKPPSELDAFMAKVLAQRDVNRQTLKQYILD